MPTFRTRKHEFAFCVFWLSWQIDRIVWNGAGSLWCIGPLRIMVSPREFPQSSDKAVTRG